MIGLELIFLGLLTIPILCVPPLLIVGPPRAVRISAPKPYFDVSSSRAIAEYVLQYTHYQLALERMGQASISEYRCIAEGTSFAKKVLYLAFVRVGVLSMYSSCRLLKHMLVYRLSIPASSTQSRSSCHTRCYAHIPSPSQLSPRLPAQSGSKR